MNIAYGVGLSTTMVALILGVSSAKEEWEVWLVGFLTLLFWGISSMLGILVDEIRKLKP